MKTGSGDKIGEYAYIRITKAQLQAITEENYKECVETVVKDSGYNWVAILCDDGTGMCFPGSMYYVGTYGKQDTDGSILEDYGAITLDENGGTRFLCLLRMFLSFRLLSPTTEKKRFCQTYAKEKRCNLKKDYNAF